MYIYMNIIENIFPVTQVQSIDTIFYMIHANEKNLFIAFLGSLYFFVSTLHSRLVATCQLSFGREFVFTLEGRG